MRYLLGVDGGGTRTRAILAEVDLLEETGVMKGWGISGPSNFHSVGVEKAVDHIVESIQIVLKKAKCERIVPDQLVLGLAGVGRPNDHAQMWTVLEKRLGSKVKEMTLTTDAHIALMGAVGGEDGVVVIAGTGAIALGIKKNRLERAGGWGYLLDDRGSGYDLGRQAITAALRSFDGRGVKTILLEQICSHFKVENITDLIAPIYHGELNRARIGELIPLIVEIAKAGDLVAQDILIDGGSELAKTAIAVAERLEFAGRFRVAGTGGILSHKLDYVYPTFVKEMIHRFPDMEIIDPIMEPVYGALVMAAKKLKLPSEMSLNCVDIQKLIKRWRENDEIRSF
ncbi:MAG: hypothetical protein KAX49_07450 [Halanaerobiales bacterium]|nr:hypothetical protein [Halanaerobiales bacterium]